MIIKRERWWTQDLKKNMKADITDDSLWSSVFPVSQQKSIFRLNKIGRKIMFNQPGGAKVTPNEVHNGGNSSKFRREIAVLRPVTR